jgi:hypothetical protein
MINESINPDSLEEAFVAIQWLKENNPSIDIITDWLNLLNIKPVTIGIWDKNTVTKLIEIGNRFDWNAPICVSNLLIEQAKILEEQGIDISSLPKL